MKKSIGTKLIAGFAAVAVMVLIAGLVGIVGVGRVGDAGEVVAYEKLPLTEAASGASKSVLGSAHLVVEFLMTDNRSAHEGLVRAHGHTLDDFHRYVEAILQGDMEMGVIGVDPNSEVAALVNSAEEKHQEYLQLANRTMDDHRRVVRGERAMEKMKIEMEDHLLDVEEKFQVLKEKAMKRDLVVLLEAEALFYHQIALVQSFLGEDYGNDHEHSHQGEIEQGFLTFDEIAKDIPDEIVQANNDLREMVMGEGRLLDKKEHLNEDRGEVIEGEEALDGAVSETVAYLEKVEDAARAEVDEAIINAGSIRNVSVAVLVVLTVLAFAAAIVLGIFISRGITKGIALLMSLADRVSKGEVPDQLEVTYQDEIGTLMTSFNDLIGYFKEMSEAARTIADGDLTSSLKPKSSKDELGNAFAVMINNLKELVTKVQEGAEQVAAASEEISGGSQSSAQGAQQIATGAEKQSAVVQQTSASMQQMNASIQQVTASTQQQNVMMNQVTEVFEEMTTSLHDVAGNARQVAASAKQMEAEAQEGGKSIDKNLEAIKKIGKSSEKIGEIIAAITDISEQINLLALNAAIEAARAGEHGRGFAVVAEGVTKLAERSQEAAKEIAEVIKETSNTIGEGIEISDKAGEAMKKIVDSVENVTGLIQSISDATVAQASSSEQAKQSVEELNQMTTQISQAAEQQSQSSDELIKGVNVLTDISQQNAAVAEESSAQAEEASSAAEELVAQSQALQQAASSFTVG